MAKKDKNLKKTKDSVTNKKYSDKFPKKNTNDNKKLDKHSLDVIDERKSKYL